MKNNQRSKRIAKVVMVTLAFVLLVQGNVFATSATASVTSKFKNHKGTGLFKDYSYGSSQITDYKKTPTTVGKNATRTFVAKVRLNPYSGWSVANGYRSVANENSGKSGAITTYHYSNVSDGHGNMGHSGTLIYDVTITKTVSNK